LRKSRNSIIISAIIATFLLGIIVIPNADAAVDMFLKIDSIPGESQDSKHTGEIEILSWSWGMTQSGTTHLGSGAGAGRVNIQDFQFIKTTDKSTPLLLLKCANGQHIPEATFVVRKAGGEAIEFFKITMTDLIISSISTGGSEGGDRPTESISLNFSKVEWSYTEENKDGKAGTKTTLGWNVAENKES